MGQLQYLPVQHLLLGVQRADLRRCSGTGHERQRRSAESLVRHGARCVVDGSRQPRRQPLGDLHRHLYRLVELRGAGCERDRDGLLESLEGFDVPRYRGFFEEQARQNMALFERTMRAFSPFATPAPEAAPPQGEEELSDLKRKVEEMSRQIERLAGKD